MLLLAFCFLTLNLPWAYAAIVVKQTDSDSPLDDQSQFTDLKYERVNIAAAGQKPVYYALACSPMYGAGLEARSCFDALSYAPRDVQQEAWAVQGRVPTGLHNPIILPAAFISSDTKCLISPNLVPNNLVAHASALNVSEAARAVIIGCVIQRRLGGVARNIGGDNKLYATAQGGPKNRPECGGSIRATTRSCGYILDEMRRDGRTEIFGKSPSPKMTVALPITLRSPDGLCQFIIDKYSIFDGDVHSTWGLVWFAAEIVVAGCVRAGRGGTTTVVGKNTQGRSTDALKVTIMDEPTQLALPGKDDNTDQEASSASTA